MKKAQAIGISFESLRTNRKEDSIVYDIDIYVRDLDQLNTYIRDLENLSHIEKVVRIIR